jgi:hypothetical protein
MANPTEHERGYEKYVYTESEPPHAINLGHSIYDLLHKYYD